MAERPAPVLVLLTEFARLVGAEPGELEALARAKRFPKASAGRVPLIDATRAYLSALRDRARDASLAAAQARAKDARAASAELSLAVERRELISDDEADAAIQHLAGVVNSVAYGLPARATRDLRARRVVERAVEAALAALAAALGEAAGNEAEDPRPRQGARKRAGR